MNNVLMIQVVVVDRDVQYRMTVSKTLQANKGLAVNEFFNNGKELLFRLKKRNPEPEVILFDISIKKGLAYDLSYIVYLNQHFPKSKIIVQSIQKVGYYVHRMYLNGIPGYIFKDCTENELYSAIYKVAEGGMYYQKEARDLMDEYVFHSSPKSDNIIFLTTSEKKLLKQMHAHQDSFTFSGEMAFESLKETATWENICLKFGTNDIFEILREAFAKGLMELP